MQLGKAMRVYLSSSVGYTDPPSLGQAMRVYLGVETKGGTNGGRDAPAMPGPVLRVLLSYHYFKEHDLDQIRRECFAGIERLDMFADSGAYSAFTVGQSVQAGDYCRWVNRWKHLFTAASAPDVIGNPVATKVATTKMLGLVTGVPVLPVFHVGEDWAYLKHWCTQPGINYIALGGMVPYTRRPKLLGQWLTKAWTIIPSSMRVHGFGLTTWPLLLRFPWYSVDSSSWTAGVRYANLSLFDDQRGQFVQVDMRERTGLLKHSALLKSYGLRPPDARNKGYDRNQIVATCVRSWQRAEAWLNRPRAQEVQVCP
jgi:hypothetical protein